MATPARRGSRTADRLLLSAAGTALLISMAAVAWLDARRGYDRIQADFRLRVVEQLGPERAAGLAAGIRQIWVPGLGRADRCITCHQAVLWKGFETAPLPSRTHPTRPIEIHPPERFGCSVCHGGQGWAVTLPDAHGDVPHWGEPLLDRELAALYSTSGEAPPLLQSNCNLCHRYERATEGAGAINLGKSLVRQKGCRSCHAVNGRGGAVGPDLTWVGDKSAEQFDYSRLRGRPTVFAWHLAHLKDPRLVVANTLMPNFHLSVRECQALALLVMSWRRVAFGAAYLPGTPAEDLPSAEEQLAETRLRSGRGGWFAQAGCAVCHSVAVLGMTSPTPIGPDLSTAADDTQKRFGVTLERYLATPSGTMAAVLSRQILLSPAQREAAAQHLRQAFREYQRIEAEGGTPLALPGGVGLER